MGDRVRGQEADGVMVQTNDGEQSVMGDDQVARRLVEIDNLNKTVESLKQINARQETAITVMRERIFELELDLVNARCAVVELENHTH